MRNWLLWLLLLALPALACNGLQRVETDEAAGPPVEQAGNLIAAIGIDDNIYIVDPADGQATAVTDDAQNALSDDTPLQLYRYPTWSPDGRHLAYVSIKHSGGSLESALIVARPDGRDRSRLFVGPDNPFYLYWSPDSQRLAFLAPHTADGLLSLQVASLQDGQAQILDTGEPYYWHWSPDSRRLFTHVGGTGGRLAFLALDGTIDELSGELEPFAFQAPAWSPDGRQILVAASAGPDDALLLTDAGGNVERTLALLDNPVAFGWSPDGAQIAYVDGSGIGQSPAGSLALLDLAVESDPAIVDEDLVFAFFWSPDGSKIAYFVLAESPFGFERQASLYPEWRRKQISKSVAQQNTLYLELRIYDVAEGNSRSLLSFEPTEEFFNILPFFDQYQHSARLWSPDSTQVLIAAVHGRQSALWTVPADGGPMPLRLTPGKIGFWSWQ